MNILMIAPYFYPHGGGAEVYANIVAKGLVKCGNNVDVLCSNMEKKNKDDLVEHIFIKRLKPDFKISSTPFKLGLFKEIYDTIQKNDYDLININYYLPYYPDIATICSKICKVPCVAMWHNDFVLDGLMNSMVQFYNYSVNRLSLCLVDKIITSSPYCYNESKCLNNFKNKIELVPPGVDLNNYTVEKKFKIHDDFNIPTSSKIVLFVGVMNKATVHKGVYELIHAFKKVNDSLNEANYLVLVGKGDMIPEYKKLCKDLGIEKKVIFTGFVPDDVLIDYYKSSDMLILPSTTVQEGFGMVLIEANACGKPVIGSKIGGIKYVIKNGETGLLVPPKDSESLAKAITKVLENDKLAKKMGKNGRKMVEEEYNWDTAIKKTNKIYESLL